MDDSFKLSITDIKQQTLFNNVDIDQIFPLMRDCKILHLDKGERLVDTKQISKHIYLIISGSFNVELIGETPETVVELNQGDSFGEVTIFNQQPAVTTVSAKEASRVAILDESLVWKLAEQSHSFSLNMLKIISSRLQHGNSVIDKLDALLKQFEHNATIDSLTSLYNRRWLDSMLERIMRRCYQNEEPLSILMLDIDNFKAYNDINGHLAGDVALRTISQLIVQHLRPEDPLTRYGGEELLAILPGLNVGEAATIADRLRNIIKQADIINSEQTPLPGITVSIGVAEMANCDAPKKLIDVADKNLYRAKHEGKDKVCY